MYMYMNLYAETHSTTILCIIVDFIYLNGYNNDGLQKCNN